MLLEKLHDFAFHIIQGIFQNRTGVYEIAIMQQITGNAQSANHATIRSIKMLIVIVHKPIYSFINNHINTSVVQGSDAGEHNGGTISLGGTAL